MIVIVSAYYYTGNNYEGSVLPCVYIVAYASLKEALYVIIEGDSEIRNVCVLISAENMNYPVGYDFAVNITSDNGI